MHQERLAWAALAGTPGAPLFVLATALSQHAVEAYALGVADYLTCMGLGSNCYAGPPSGWSSTSLRANPRERPSRAGVTERGKPQRASQSKKMVGGESCQSRLTSPEREATHRGFFARHQHRYIREQIPPPSDLDDRTFLELYLLCTVSTRASFLPRNGAVSSHAWLEDRLWR